MNVALVGELELPELQPFAANDQLAQLLDRCGNVSGTGGASCLCGGVHELQERIYGEGSLGVPIEVREGHVWQAK